MGLFSKKIGPVFLNETCKAQDIIDKLLELQKRAEGEAAKKIEAQINIMKYGKLGEENIAFELKNSGMDMYILHDIYLKFEELSAQIDYIVITRKHVYIIECKNLVGNIEIDHTGAFIRTYNVGGKSKKEGIYSPITQNERHLQILKEIRKDSKNNFLLKMLFEKNFESVYQSIVVLANPKTYLNAKYAKKQIKDQVIRADQLIGYMKQKDALVKDYEWTDKAMLELAHFYLAQNKQEQSDYVKKYEDMVDELHAEEASNKNNKENESEMISCHQQEEKIETIQEEQMRRLKEFRLQRSREEKIKAYYIFNDAQMSDLLERKPRNKEELLEISGFGKVKVEKYGEDILKILWNN